MADAATDAVELGLRIAESLEQAGIPYALGGALALGVWAIPRLTLDVDVNIFVEEDGLPSALAALVAAGVQVDAERARIDAREQGMFEGRGSGMRVDVFTPSIDFSWEAMRTRVRVDRDGQSIWFLSAEALCVLKLLFFRGKDDDPRVATWDRLVADHGAAR